jgi:hypothetical protein
VSAEPRAPRAPRAGLLRLPRLRPEDRAAAVSRRLQKERVVTGAISDGDSPEKRSRQRRVTVTYRINNRDVDSGALVPLPLHRPIAIEALEQLCRQRSPLVRGQCEGSGTYRVTCHARKLPLVRSSFQRAPHVLVVGPTVDGPGRPYSGGRGRGPVRGARRPRGVAQASGGRLRWGPPGSHPVPPFVFSYRSPLAPTSKASAIARSAALRRVTARSASEAAAGCGT